MKKWRQLAVMGIFALYLSGCQGNSKDVSDTQTTAEQTQSAQSQDSAPEETEKKQEESSGEKTGEETPAADAEEIKMSNPMQEVSGPEALAEIGVSMEVLEEAENVQCFIISQVVAEVNFSLEGTAYTYRGSATAEDFSGIFEEFEDEVVTIADTGDMGLEGDLRIKTTKSGGKLASWAKNGAQYTLYTPSSVEEDGLVSLCQKLMEKN